MNDLPGSSAERIAERGREELLARLRAAFAEQLSHGATPAALSGDEFELRIAQAGERAGGALWRRSLAQAAVTELHIDLAAAIEHPDVLRAHELLGAPAYTLPAEPPQEAAAEVEVELEEPPEPVEAEAPAEAIEAELETPAEAIEAELEAPTEPIEAEAEAEAPAAPIEAEAAAEAIEIGPPAEPIETMAPAEAPETAPADVLTASPLPTPVAQPPATEPEVEALRVGAVHVSGIESLRAGERDIELRFSPDSIDVLKRSSGVGLGRVRWIEITNIELPPPRRGLRRRPQELRIETARGRATFELPGLTTEQLEGHLKPMLARARDEGDARY